MNKVFLKKELCCGCGLCVKICPKQAIKMKEDSNGFMYPIIDKEKCINCHKCVRACSFSRAEKYEQRKCFAGANIDKKQMLKSTSAGIFAAVATALLESGAVVCGASMKFSDDEVRIKHAVVSSINDLEKLQGSKYVQSDFSSCYNEVLSYLKQGKRVLISGTPCQIANARSVFQKYNSQIYYIDIICHGVPNARMFNEYLQCQENIMGKKIIDFKFRNKKYGWGLLGSYVTDENKENILNPKESSYYQFFLKGEIYRGSCYQCPYAEKKRVGDITIGDYWGAEKYTPELMTEEGGPFLKEEGISCILINTKKGEEILRLAKDKMILKEIDISNVLIRNTQLRRPAEYSFLRRLIFMSYSKRGYDGIDNLYMIWRKLSDLKAKFKK